MRKDIKIVDYLVGFPNVAYVWLTAKQTSIIELHTAASLNLSIKPPGTVFYM